VSEALSLTPKLIGHEAAIACFMQAVQTRLHHGWLIHGAHGIGKSTFAYHCALHLLSNGRQKIGALDPQEKNFKLVESGAHPDLIVLAPPVDEKTGLQKDEIPVAMVRELTAFFQKTSGQGGWRIALIRGADTLGRSAANALLKILEEPPQRAMLLMTADARGKLLPTIRSRCRSLALMPLSVSEMSAVMRESQDEVSPSDVVPLQVLSKGSPGTALLLLKHDGLQLYRDFLTLLQTPSADRMTTLLRFIGAGGKQEAERFAIIARFCDDWLQRIIHLAVTGDVQEVTQGEGQLLRRMAAIRPLDDWFAVSEHCQKQYNLANQANLDKRLVLIDNLNRIVA